MKKKVANEVYILPPDSTNNGYCNFFQEKPCIYALNPGMVQPDECQQFVKEEEKFGRMKYMLYQPNEFVYGSQDMPEDQYQRIWYFDKRKDGRFYINTMPDVEPEDGGGMETGKFYCRVEGDINNLKLKLKKMEDMKSFMTEYPATGGAGGEGGDKAATNDKGDQQSANDAAE